MSLHRKKQIDSLYKRFKPQHYSLVTGSLLVIVGFSLVGLSQAVVEIKSVNSELERDNLLKVVPSSQLPTSSINDVQGASGLQGPTDGSLQQPVSSDVLQPNAKTDKLE